MDPSGDLPCPKGQQLEPPKPISIVNVASGARDVEALEKMEKMKPMSSSLVKSPATVTPVPGTLFMAQSPSTTSITSTVPTAKNVQTIKLLKVTPALSGVGIAHASDLGLPLAMTIAKGSGFSTPHTFSVARSSGSVTPVTKSIVQNSGLGSPQKGQSKTVNLLMTPVLGKSPAGTGDGEAPIIQDGSPRPVHLVTRFGLTNNLPKSVSPPRAPTSSVQLVPVSQVSTSAATTSPNYSKEYKMTLGGKSVRVVTVSPKKTLPPKETYPDANLTTEEKAKYNRTLLEYVNKTMSKSGRITLIKDIFNLRSLVRQAENKLVIIDFFTMGSPSCQTIAPRLQQLSLKYPDIIFLKVDVERTKECALLYNIKSTPTFIMLQAGVKIYQLQGADVSELEEKIKVLQRETPPQIRLVKTLPVTEKTTTPSNNSTGVTVVKTAPKPSENLFPASDADPTKKWILDPVTGNLTGIPLSPMTTDDPTILIEKERQYISIIKQRQSQKGKKPTTPAINRHTASLKNQTKAPKRKNRLNVVFIPNKTRKPTTPRDSPVPVAAFSFERMPSKQTDKIKRLVENDSSSVPDIPPPSSSPIDYPHSSLLVPSPSTELPTYFNMDTHEIALEDRRFPPYTPTPAEDCGINPNEDLVNTVHSMYRKLEDVLNYVRRLEAKVDALMPRDTSRVSMGTQTDETDVVSPVISCDQTSTSYDVSLPISQTPPPVIPLPQPVIPSIPPFKDSRMWQLRPSDLDGEQITPERLTEAIADLPINPPATDDLDISQHEMSEILAKSHSFAHLAKNLMFRGFKLKEMYRRNANGKNYGGPKKVALNKTKVQKIMSIVRLHYNKEDNVGKRTVTALNSGLRYLWNVRFKHTWLPLDTIPIPTDSDSDCD